MVDSGKMTALNASNTGLLDLLKTAATNNGDVYVSIVPFVKDVNVGSSNPRASWMYFDDASTRTTPRGMRTSARAVSGARATGQCNNARLTTQSACTSGGYCSNSSHHSQNAGATWIGTWTSNNIWTLSNHSNWNGCVMDRGDPGVPDTGNYDTNVVAPATTIMATQCPAEQYNSPQAVMGTKTTTGPTCRW